MGFETLLPLGVSVLSSLAKSGGGGGGQQQPQQGGGMQMMPQNPFPQNFPDGGKKAPSVFDILGNQGGGMQGGPQPQGSNPMSILDVINPVGQSSLGPVGGGLIGTLLKGLIK